MVPSDGSPGPDSDVGQLEEAASRFVAWATRIDHYQWLMRQAKCDLSSRQLWLLGRLDRWGPIRLSEVAAAVGVERSTLTPQAQRLERDGLIERLPDQTDGRAALIRVTRSGKALQARLRAANRAMYAELLADWPPADRAQLAKLLGDVVGLLEASTETAGREGAKKAGARLNGRARKQRPGKDVPGGSE